MKNKYNRNYGILTDASKELNEFFGDDSGRTISLRTSHGFKKAFNLDISDETAEDIVHLTMATSAYNLLNKNGNKTIGALSLLALLALYQKGK